MEEREEKSMDYTELYSLIVQLRELSAKKDGIIDELNGIVVEENGRLDGCCLFL